MSTKIAELAEKLALTPEELKKKISDLGFKVAPRARVIDDELAQLIFDEVSKKEEPVLDEEEPTVAPDNIAEIYDEIISEKQEREIVKSQRKKTAGKDSGAKKSDHHEAAKIIAKDVAIPEIITVKEFAEKTGLNVAKVIGELMKNGVLANINQQIDFDTAQVIAEDLGIKIKRIREVAGTEEFLAGDISRLIKEDDSSMLKERPPVVCVMGHVDHGKTRLLDTIRSTNVVAKEAGGITQHIGAYQVEKKGKLITFLDTPGHEAFTAMRARGAKVTDIAILVVAADEGIKPQTIEALNHAKDANVPIIVALTKIDKADINLDRVKGQLAEHGLQPEDWGGKTIVVGVSAVSGEGIDDLLDMIILTAEIENLKANPEREAVGTVIEAHLDQSLGPVATILINTGTLKIMNTVIVGSTYGRIKVMRDHAGKALAKAGPSTPVQIAGLDATPKSGDILQVVKDERTAREKAEEISLITKSEGLDRLSASNQLISQVKSEKLLKLIIKADTKGSLEAIRQSIAGIKDEEVAVKLIHSGVGTITESDVMMARASSGLVVGFNTDFDSGFVIKTAERENVQVKLYKVIYDLLEDVKKVLTGLLEPEVFEVVLGRADVRKIFLTKRKEMILGCKVMSGKLENKAKLRIIRGKDGEGNEKIVGEGVIDMLRKVDEAIHEIKEGNDCGIKFIGSVPVEEGDVLEAYKIEKKSRII